MKSAPGDYLTTGRIARMLGLTERPVRMWCDRGMLPSHRVGSRKGVGYRRVRVDHLRAFLEDHGIPMPAELAEAVRPPVVMTAGLRFAEGFLEAATAAVPNLRWSDDSPLRIAHLAGTDPPDAVLIGCEEGLGAAVELAKILLATPNPPAVALVLGEDCDPWDDRLSAVRSRLAWLGTEPPRWDGVLACLGLLPAVTDACEETEAAGEPGGVVARRGVRGVGIRLRPDQEAREAEGAVPPHDAAR